MNRFDLYERCVTEPERVCRFLEAAHGREPRTLREDFSGTGALARCWASRSKGNLSVAVDADATPLAYLAREAAKMEIARRVRRRHCDVLACDDRADIIAATNFPICYWHTRESLVRYLRTSRQRLSRGGIFACDLYGGRDAFRRSTTKRRIRGPGKQIIEYTFEQREATALAGRVHDVLSFRVAGEGTPTRAKVFKDAFVYDWRLWSIPELKDAMVEAGFRGVEVYDELGDAVDGEGRLYIRPMAADETLDDNWVVYLVARK